MKKFYPNLKFGLLIILFYLTLLFFLFIVCVMYEKMDLSIKIGLMILFASGVPIFFVALTSSAQVDDAYLIYKETYFSREKKIFLEDVKNITLKYLGRSRSIEIIYRDKKLTGNKSGRLSIPIDILLIQELLRFLPKELFHVSFIYRFQIPKKHREFFLDMDLLDEKQRAKISDI